MARWREGVFSPQTPAVHWQFNPALSRSKAKHLFVPGSQNPSCGSCHQHSLYLLGFLHNIEATG